MLLNMMKSKIHRATITESNLNYEGSMTVDRDLMDAARMIPYEQIHVLNVNTGDRFVTYVIEGEAGSGVICLNGAAARMGQPGDLVIAITYAQMGPQEAAVYKPCTVYVDEKNKIVSHR